jgi:hypothetical protein
LFNLNKKPQYFSQPWNYNIPVYVITHNIISAYVRRTHEPRRDSKILLLCTVIISRYNILHCWGGAAVRRSFAWFIWARARAAVRDDRGDIITTHNIISYNNIYIFSLQETEEPHSSKPRYSTPILMAAVVAVLCIVLERFHVMNTK